jgi:O-antigen/teichoic acid export membrane protein
MNMSNIKGRVEAQIKRFWRYFKSDTLFRNSVYLMLGTGVLAGFGFFFWLINSHLFSVSDIGLATTLISVMSLISMLSLIGFDTVFVRFLPKSDQKNENMNTGLILVSAISILLSVGFLAAVGTISPRLSFITGNPVYELIFVFSCLMNSLNSLTNSIFLAGRKAAFTLIVNIVLSIFKIVLPFALIGFGVMGIFIAVTLAQTIGSVLSIVIVIQRFDYHPAFDINKGVLRTVWRYSATNYAAGVLNLLPSSILPILITNSIGPEASAYFYIVMMMGNLLYTIPTSVTTSLFAEGSHDEKSLEENIKKSLKIIACLLTPAIIILLLCGNFILKIFGKSYAEGGTTFLYLVTITGVVVSINAIFNSFFRVKKALAPIFVTNLVYTISLIGLSYLLLPFGLTGIGFAWLLGTAVLGFTNYLYSKDLLLINF